MTHHNEARTEKTDLWKKNKNILLVLFKRKKERKIWYCSKKVHSGKKNNVSVLAPIGGLHMPSVRLFESVFGRKCLLEKNQTELESYLGGPIQVRGSSSSGLAANTTKTKRKSESNGMSCPGVPWMTYWMERVVSQEVDSSPQSLTLQQQQFHVF